MPWTVDDTGFPKKVSIRSGSRANTVDRWASKTMPRRGEPFGGDVEFQFAR